MSSTMNRWIVITTINRPTKAILAITKIVASDGWRCVVVGDKKTPADWAAPGIDYLSYESQLKMFGRLAELLPANHYCRKNLGYLYAMRQGAQVILETDDDNIPDDTFGKDIRVQVEGELVGEAKWSNIYKHFTSRLIWPRGNPLDTIHGAGQLVGAHAASAPLQQFLADGDPDVDAVYRLLFKEPLHFDKRAPLFLKEGTWCSFNSQNTLFFRDVFPLLYLPCHVSFRMTDIWRSFVAQLGLWCAGHQLVFRSATVVQERNEHNLMRDFSDEVDGYLNNALIVDRLTEVLNTHRGQPLHDVVRAAWVTLRDIGILKSVELDIYDAWAAECRAAA
jgi:hypothetical protein